MTIKLTMYYFLVHFIADSIFDIYKTNHGSNLIFGTKIILKPFFRTCFFFEENPLKSRICFFFIMKLAVSRTIKGKNQQLFWCFKRFFLTGFLVFFSYFLSVPHTNDAKEANGNMLHSRPQSS